MRNKKDFIIQQYIKNPHLDLTKLARDNYIHPSHISRTVNQFKESITNVYPIYCVNSLSEENTKYLFANDNERKLVIKNNVIINDVTLTDYEKVWLGINERIYARE